MDVCGWCRRRSETPLGAGEICDVCVGLCAFAFVPPEPALYLYRQSAWWVERTFSFLYDQRERLAPKSCWWCGRLGEPVPKLSAADGVYFADPTLCPVCDQLLIATPPTDLGIASVKQAYARICHAVA